MLFIVPGKQKRLIKISKHSRKESMSMDVSLTGISLHVQDMEKSKAFYLSLPGAVLEHERPGFFASIRIGSGRINLVRLGREERFHIEIGTNDLEALREHLQQIGVQESGPQPLQWGERGLITRDPEGNFVEFDDHLE
jgi:catechol 2,3-dioxygenase-like lactoylglutathione lyase family enzyme